MAARINRVHSQDIRRKIQALVIIDRLQKHVRGDIEMSATQVSAANSLLDRTIPKLQTITHTGDEKNPVVMKTIERVIVDSKN